jgi:hypothetical protein
MKLPSRSEVDKALEAIDGRRKVLETNLQAVVNGYTSAAFVWGPPGLGKSHVLTLILDALCPGGWKHHTGYMTPKGMILALAENPAAIHLFEDCEKMLKTDATADKLRAACGAPGQRDRLVTHETANETYRIVVTGGIIIATNENLSRKNGPLQGVASRFRPIKWDMTLQERVATIVSIAEHGFRRGKTVLTAKECKEVADSLFDYVETTQDDLALDIRLFCEHALPTFAYCKDAGVKNWESVLASKLTGIASTKEEKQSERSGRLDDLAWMIHNGQGTQAMKLADWKAKTGLGKAIFYRHLKAAKKAAK